MCLVLFKMSLKMQDHFKNAGGPLYPQIQLSVGLRSCTLYVKEPQVARKLRFGHP